MSSKIPVRCKREDLHQTSHNIDQFLYILWLYSDKKKCNIDKNELIFIIEVYKQYCENINKDNGDDEDDENEEQVMLPNNLSNKLTILIDNVSDNDAKDKLSKLLNMTKQWINTGISASISGNQNIHEMCKHDHIAFMFKKVYGVSLNVIKQMRRHVYAEKFDCVIRCDDSRCICGWGKKYENENDNDKGLMNSYYVYNNETKEVLVVGSRCINKFDIAAFADWKACSVCGTKTKDGNAHNKEYLSRCSNCHKKNIIPYGKYANKPAFAVIGDNKYNPENEDVSLCVRYIIEQQRKKSTRYVDHVSDDYINRNEPKVMCKHCGKTVDIVTLTCNTCCPKTSDK